MTLSLPHNITNGTVPDADEVMANFNALLGQTNDTYIVGDSSASTVSRTVAAGVGTTTGTLASVTFTVDVPSVIIAGVSGLVTRSNKNGAFTATMNLLLDGSAQIAQIFSEDLALQGTDQIEGGIPMTGFKKFGLTAGSHTIAVEYSLNVTRAVGTLATNAVRGVGASWAGLVMPT